MSSISSNICANSTTILSRAASTAYSFATLAGKCKLPRSHCELLSMVEHLMIWYTYPAWQRQAPQQQAYHRRRLLLSGKTRLLSLQTCATS